MNSTRDVLPTHLIRRSLLAACIAGASLAASQALAETVSIQFSQSYPGGGTVTGLLVGEDLDGDGRLYSVAPPLANFLGIEGGGDEVTYASVRIEGVLGQTVTNVFDASVADINDPSNFFWGFAYNIDGGTIGDDSDEGLAFAPLAPSTSYVVGELFSPAFGNDFFNTPLTTCGLEDDSACAGIATLDPVDPFPNFELLFAATSASPVVTNELLRYTFEQDGFDGGASITGTISGRDLDGDGRIYSAGSIWRDLVGFPAGDEVAYATVTIRGMAPQAITNIVDLTAGDINDLANVFFAADINVAGDRLGDEGTEGLSIAPFSPSTSYVIGGAFSPFVSPSFGTQGLANCGNAEGEPCAALVTLTPNPESPTGVDLQAIQFSAEPASLSAAPLVVDGGFSGHWFKKTPSGEGVIVQVINDGRVLVYWLTYNDDGAQRWMWGVGQRAGLTVTIDDVYVTDNGVFNSEVPVLVDIDPVGSLEIEFQDCDNAVVNSVIDGVPQTTEIGRLTGLSSLECTR